MVERVEEKAGPSLLGRLGRLVGEVVGCLGYRLAQQSGGGADWAGRDCVGEAIQPGVGVVGGVGDGVMRVVSLREAYRIQSMQPAD